jgi:cyclase
VDEVVLLDITRNLNFDSNQKNIFFSEMKKISENSYIPLTVGGGIRELKHIEKLLKNGADKIVINSKAIENINFIKLAAKEFGSQCIVVSIDIKKKNESFFLMQNYGKKISKFNTLDYIKNIQDNNAGEIFLQSIDRDGSLLGYDMEILEYIKNAVNIPLIVSSGAGNWLHVKNALSKNYVSAASLTNIYHFTEKSIKNLKHTIKDTVFIRE